MLHDYGSCRWTTRVKMVANCFHLNVNVESNNELKTIKQESNNIEKDTRKKKKRKITGTCGGDYILSGASLPDDIIINILPMLPAKSLLRFRCVCKSWYSLIKSASFAKHQLDYSLKNRNNGILIDFSEKICYLDYDSLSLDSLESCYNLVHFAYPSEYKKEEIIGSCSGLVCYRSSQVIIFWNPYTTVYKKIQPPPDPRGEPRPWQDCRYGFCYDSETEDYKLVMLRAHTSSIHVYSSKLNSWKTITNTDIRFGLLSKKLVFFRGFFHWVTNYPYGHAELYCFDTANETVKQILLPQRFTSRLKSAQACLLGGYLCVIGTRCGRTNNHISEVWTVKNYGVAESWTRTFTINRSLSRLEHLNFKQVFKDDAILVHHRDCSTYLYDLNHGVARKLKIDENLIRPKLQTWTFSGSLVSPNLCT